MHDRFTTLFNMTYGELSNHIKTSQTGGVETAKVIYEHPVLQELDSKERYVAEKILEFHRRLIFIDKSYKVGGGIMSHSGDFTARFAREKVECRMAIYPNSFRGF
jgi:hypothetical protein